MLQKHSNDMTSAQDNIKLYFDFLSQPSRALYIILKSSGKPFQPCSVNLLKGENLSDEYQQQVNRFRKVPAIVDGDFKLAESVAILRYLAHKQYIPSEWYPADLQQRARIDEFLQWQHNGIRTSCSLYFWFVWVQPRIMGTTAAAGKVLKYKKAMEKDLALLENVWLQDGKFLTGNALTVADIFGACEVQQIRATAYNVRPKYPKVADWIESVRAVLNPHFDEAHQIIYKHEQETMNI